MECKLIDVSSYPVSNVLDTLLSDKSTKKNIIWATDTYAYLGGAFADTSAIEPKLLADNPDVIRPRIQKSQQAQAQRTRKKAEVFTPVWLCNHMNNHCDTDWFGRAGVFNTENSDNTWTVNVDNVEFPKGKSWKSYVDSRRLEITCGEAPFLVSRYDASTGELILPSMRTGVLDRKFRIVNENTNNYKDWMKWAVRAIESCYGYDYQGDNVLIARINVLLTFLDYHNESWVTQITDKTLSFIANKIAWNIWQMDGLNGTVPLGKPYVEFRQLSLFEAPGTEDDNGLKAVPCVVKNWRSNCSLKFTDLKEGAISGKKAV